MSKEAALARVNAEIDTVKILLESDHRLPSVAGLVTGRRLTGSWWGDPDNKSIYRVLGALWARKDVLQTRLVSGKVTFVHKDLWPEFLSVSTSGEPWQMKGVSPAGKRLLSMVRRNGEVVTLEAQKKFGASLGKVAVDLERRLLVYGEQFHSPLGFHSKRLATWKKWAEKAGFSAELPPPDASRTKFEDVVDGLNSRYSGTGKLPWRK